MTDTYTIFFYLHNQEEIRQIKSLDLLLQKFVSYGYYLTAEADLWSVQAQFNQWLSQLQTEQDQIPPIPFQPGISDQGRKQVASFCQAQVGQCELGGFWAAISGPGRGFDFRLTLYNTDPIPGTLGISFDQDFVFLAVWQHIVANPDLLAGFSEQGSFAQALKPEVSELLLREVQSYRAERREMLTLTMCSMARTNLLRGFQFSTTLAPAESYVLLQVDGNRFFGDTPRCQAMYQYWLEAVIKQTHQCWHPLYIHAFDHYGVVPNLTQEEIRALMIFSLYDLNIFGPELVEKLGRERLLQAPVWKVEEFADQAILLIPEDSYGTSGEPQCYRHDTVADYLGLAVSKEESRSE